MDYTYLYDFNRERYQKLAERGLVCRDDLTAVTVEEGYLLPNRYAPNRLFGHGGVLNAHKEYLKCSEMNAYSKYAVTPKETDEVEIYLGEGYEIDEKDVPYLDEEIIYLGYINNHWGHFLLDSTTRLYPFLKDVDKRYKYAYLVNEGQDYTPVASIARFFELLGIRDRLVFINKVTRCRRIVIPEQGYMVNGYYSKEFLALFDTVAGKVDCTKYPFYEKVYYSRSNFKKAKGSEIGEEMLLDLFRKNDFTIIAPEKCTLDEQIAIVRNSKLLAAITGTIPHNLLFAAAGQKILIINKTHNLNVAQMDINEMKKVEATYIDAYLAKFPVLIGMGPFFLYNSEPLRDYITKNHWKNPEGAYTSDDKMRENAKNYEHVYRMKYIQNLNLSYCKDLERFDYFHPQHLLAYEEATYGIVMPASAGEKLQKLYERVNNKWKSIMKK